MYTGPVDGDGKPDGIGELDYVDGDLFVGQFDHGTMVDGVLRRVERVLATRMVGMKTAWTEHEVSELVRQHPQNIVVFGNWQTYAEENEMSSELSSGSSMKWPTR